MNIVEHDRAVEEGDRGAEAAEKAAAEARKQAGVESIQVEPGGVGFEIILKPTTPTAKKSRAHVLFATKTAPFITPVQRKAPVSPLAADPRTHVDAQNPAGDPDAPTSRTALVVAPFHTKSYYAFSREVWVGKGEKKKRLRASFAKTTGLKVLGDDPEWIAKELGDAGYDVKLLIDDQATPGAIFCALQTHPSIVYIGTHGGVGEYNQKSLAVAGFLGAKSLEGRPKFLTFETATERLCKLLDDKGVPEAARDGVSFGCAEVENGFAFVFPVLWPKFFEEALGKSGAASSFVYLDGCFTADYPALARAFNAKAFIGSSSTIAGRATARFSRYIFSNMIHRGHSVREAVDRLRNLAKGAYVIYLEDSILSPVAQGDVDLAVESGHVQSWGIGQKPYESISSEVFSLMRMARWENKDVNNGADSLARCFNLFWKPPGKRPGIGEPFCNSGIIGNHTPAGPEVDDARHLVSGRPSIPIGRFVIR